MVNARVVRRKRRGENSLKTEGWFWRGTGCVEFMTKIWSFEAFGGNSGTLSRVLAKGFEFPFLASLLE